MKLILTQLLLLLLGFAYPLSTSAASLPPELVKGLDAREQKLKYTTFVWGIVENRKYEPSDPKAVAADARQTAVQARSRAQQKGIKDNQAVQKFVDKEVALTQRLEQGYHFSFSDKWNFVCNGAATSVAGHNQFSPSSSVKYLQYYGDGQGVLAQYGVKSADTSPSVINIWSCSGNCIQQTYPFPESLNLSATDFAVLLGKDPTKVYGSVWSVTSSNAQNIQIEAELGKGSRYPSTIKITLDKDHGYAPSYAEVHSSSWLMKCFVKRFRPYQGTWISADVSVSEKWFQDLTQERDWKLQQVKPSHLLVLNFSKTSEVLDYRLLNKDPMPGDILKASQKQDTKLVQYYWPGKLPSIDALTRLDQQQHPGEGTPDPSQSGSAAASASKMVSSALPFIGGVLCLVGGVWMFKQRKTN